MTEHRAWLDAAVSFADVIDAFHVSRGGQPTQTRFFVDERASRQGITLTPNWHDGDLRQVWNLVLACYRRNSAKGARPPPTGCPG